MLKCKILHFTPNRLCVRLILQETSEFVMKLVVGQLHGHMTRPKLLWKLTLMKFLFLFLRLSIGVEVGVGRSTPLLRESLSPFWLTRCKMAAPQKMWQKFACKTHNMVTHKIQHAHMKTQCRVYVFSFFCLFQIGMSNGIKFSLSAWTAI